MEGFRRVRRLAARKFETQANAADLMLHAHARQCWENLRRELVDMNRHMGGESGHPRACRTRLRTAHLVRRAGTENTQEKFFSGRPTRTNPVHLSGPWWGPS